MLKSVFIALGAAVLVAALATDSSAQHGGMAPQMMPGQTMPGQMMHGQMMPGHMMPGPMPPGARMMPPPQGYPQLHAPMYPCPVPNVPAYVGGTTYTNQAFAPHEMLYPHEYKSLYPPFYYKVRGGWWWTPFGIESHDKWELQGTEVKVKYRSSYRWFSGFHPPVSIGSMK